MMIGYFANGQKNNLVFGLDGGANYLFNPNFNSSDYIINATPICVPTFGLSLGYYLIDDISIKSGFYYSPVTNYKINDAEVLNDWFDEWRVKDFKAFSYIFPLVLKIDVPINKLMVFLELGGSMNIVVGSVNTVQFLNGDGIRNDPFFEQNISLCAGLGASYPIYKNIGLGAEIIYSNEFGQDYNPNLCKFLQTLIGITYTTAFANKSISK